MSYYVMGIVEHADDFIGKPGKYLKGFDIEAYGGRGYAWFTPQASEAYRFKSPGEVFEVWKTQSKTMPYRQDGKPNRPLTAYSITPRLITEDEHETDD
jgi:hypothetical protein